MDKLFFIESVVFNLIVLWIFCTKKNVLYAMPFLPFTGKWLFYLNDSFPNIVYHYLEILFYLYFILLFIKIDHKKLKSDWTFVLLICLPLSSLITIINIDSLHRFSNYFLLLFQFMCLPSIYLIAKENRFDVTRISENLSLIWIFIGWIYKVISSIQFDIPFYFIRGGGTHYASNHLGYFLILTYPFIKKRVIKSIVLLTLFLSFSRALMIIALIFTLYELRFYLKIWMAIFYSLILIILKNLTGNLLINNLLFSLVILRFTKSTSYSNNLNSNASLFEVNSQDFNSIFHNFLDDDRVAIWKYAFQIFSENNFLGIGFGNFYDHIIRINGSFKYSNAHNLYLNSLVEGGILFISVLISLIYILLRHKSGRVKVSVLLFLIYGLFSGQMYEEGQEMSLVDFTYFLILITYASKHKKYHSKQI